VRPRLSAGGSTAAGGNGALPPPGHIPCGPSLSAPLACWFSRRVAAVHLCEPWPPTLAPDRRGAGSHARLSRVAHPRAVRLLCPKSCIPSGYPGRMAWEGTDGRTPGSILVNPVITATRTTSCRKPHRSGRAGFPHPVPRSPSACATGEPNRRHPVWRSTLLSLARLDVVHDPGFG
jgi:hypothetical protein